MHDDLTWDNTKDGKPRRKPLFCKECGKRLIPDRTIMGYDEYTGEPIQPFLHQDTCPDDDCGMDCGWG